MNVYLMFGILAIGLPIFYYGVLQFYKSDFEEENNRNRKLLCSVPEILVMLVSEAALFKICYEYGQEKMQGAMLALLYLSLVIMSVLCITDYWERVVPNKVLLLYILFGSIVIGAQGVLEVMVVLKMFPSMMLGLIFCGISFGVSFLISRGSLGSGDVKLALLLGIFMTGEYVVGAVFYGCLCSALYSVVQLLRKRLTRKDEIPFVPFLYIGLIIIYLVG